MVGLNWNDHPIALPLLIESIRLMHLGLFGSFFYPLINEVLNDLKTIVRACWNRFRKLKCCRYLIRTNANCFALRSDADRVFAVRFSISLRHDSCSLLFK